MPLETLFSNFMPYFPGMCFMLVVMLMFGKWMNNQRDVFLGYLKHRDEEFTEVMERQREYLKERDGRLENAINRLSDGITKMCKAQ